MATMPDVFTGKPAAHPTNLQDTVPTHTRHAITILNEKAHKPGLFTSFSPKPLGISFETQEPDEEILLLVRKHLITNVPWVLTAIALFLFSFLLFPFLRSDTFSNVFFLPDSYILVFVLGYYLVLAGYVLQQFASWYYQIGLITNFRIVDVDFHSLLSRNVAYTEVIDIVDIEIVQGGFLHNFFNYGSVQLQTEGLKANFEFTNIPKPHIVADTISDIMRMRKGEKG